MSFANRHDENEIAEQYVAESIGMAVISGIERVDDIAASPRVGVDRTFDLENLVEVCDLHGGEPGLVLENCAHFPFPCSDDFSATLSRI